MALVFSCDQCGKRYEVAESMAGKRGKCKACGAPMQVPGGTATGPVARRPAAAPADVFGFEEDEAPRGGGPRRDEAVLPRGRASRRAEASGSGGVPFGVWLGAGAAVLVLVAVVIGVLATHHSGPRKVAQQAPEGEEQLPAADGPAETPQPPAATSGRFKRDETQAVSTVPTWRVKVDPGPEKIAYPNLEKLAVRIPESFSHGDDLIVPSTLSPFVLLGGNDVEAQFREVWDLRGGTRVGRIQGKLEVAQPIALSPDGAYFVCHTHPVPRTTDIWRVADAKRIARIEDDAKSIPDVIDFAGPDRVFIGASYTKLIQVWDFQTGKVVGKIQTPDAFIKESVTLSPTRRYLALTLTPFNARLLIYDLKTGRQLGEAPVPADPERGLPLSCDGLAFAPDGTALTGVFTASGSAHLLTWDLATGQLESDHRFTGLNPLGKTFAYNGQPVQWLPDLSGWLIHDQSIVERKSGQLAWSLPFDPQKGFVEAPRRLIDSDRAIIVTMGKDRQKVIRSIALPRTKIEAALALARGGGSAADATLPPLSAADRSAAKVVAAPPAPVSWTVAPPSAEASASKKPAGRSIPLRVNSSDLLGLLASPGSAQALVTSAPGGRIFAAQKAQQGQEPRQVDRIDLATGRALNRFEIAPISLPIAFSPDASRVLLAHSSSRDRLDVVTAADGKHLVGWRPYEAESGEDKAVVWSDFLTAQQVLTVNPAGTLILWSVPEAKAVYVAERACQPGFLALSPDRKWLAVLHEGRPRLLDPATGAVLGDGEPAGTKGGQTWSPAAFRVDGRELAAVVEGAIVRWDVATGKVVDEFPSPVPKASQLQYGGPDHLLIDARTLIDLKGKRLVWVFDGGVHAPGGRDGSHWYGAGPIAGTGTATLLALELPGKEVGRVEAAADDPKTKAMLRAGATVSVQVEGAPPRDADAFRRKVLDGLNARLQATGAQVADNQPVRLVATFQEKHPGYPIELRMLGGDPKNPQKRMINAHDLEITLALTDGQGTPVPIAKEAVGARTFGLTMLPAGENDWEGYLRTQQWLAAADRLAAYPLPYFVARRAEGTVVLPGWTSLGHPTH